MEAAIPAGPEIPIRRWASCDTFENRTRDAVELCKQLFDAYDEDRDGEINMSQIEKDSGVHHPYTPCEVGFVNFDEFLKLMVHFDGNPNDEISLTAYFDGLNEIEFNEIMESLNEDYVAAVGTIPILLQKIVDRSATFLNNTDFTDKLNTLDSRSHTAILLSLSKILSLANDAETSYQQKCSLRYEELNAAVIRAFDKFDTDSDGVIIWEEFKEVFRSHLENCHKTLPPLELDQYAAKFASLQMDQFDENEDGQVTYQEFFQFLCLEDFHGDKNDTEQVVNYLGILDQDVFDVTLGVIQFYEQACVDTV